MLVSDVEVVNTLFGAHMECTGEKLTGHEFYTTLGAPKHILAPVNRRMIHSLLKDGGRVRFALQDPSQEIFNRHGVHSNVVQVSDVNSCSLNSSSRLFVTSKKYREKSFQTVPLERPLVVQVRFVFH
jgi:hypothetical protein